MKLNERICQLNKWRNLIKISRNDYEGLFSLISMKCSELSTKLTDLDQSAETALNEASYSFHDISNAKSPKQMQSKLNSATELIRKNALNWK